jgi:hypothetical protein
MRAMSDLGSLVLDAQKNKKQTTWRRFFENKSPIAQDCASAYSPAL